MSILTLFVVVLVSAIAMSVTVAALMAYALAVVLDDITCDSD